MIRFVISFVFFGLLFYLMSVYWPEGFQGLVGLADKTVVFVTDVVKGILPK